MIAGPIHSAEEVGLFDRWPAFRLDPGAHEMLYPTRTLQPLRCTIFLSKRDRNKPRLSLPILRANGTLRGGFHAAPIPGKGR